MNIDMRSQLSPFLAGCMVTAGLMMSQSAVSTSGVEPATEQMIQQAASNTAQAVVLALQENEQEQLDKIPDPLDCNSFSWMDSCEEINKQAKLNPQAPMRVQRKDGLEFNFPPGTPTPVINAMLNDSPAATQQMIDYLDELAGHHQSLANRYKEQLWAQGGLKNVEMSADRAAAKQDLPKDTIDQSNVKITLLYDSRCAACKTTLANLRDLKDKYPEIPVSAFQFDADPKAVERVKEQYGVAARMLTQDEVDRLRSTGVQVVPTMWIDNPAQKKRLQREGTVSLTVIESELEKVSNYRNGGRG